MQILDMNDFYFVFNSIWLYQLPVSEEVLLVAWIFLYATELLGF